MSDWLTMCKDLGLLATLVLIVAGMFFLLLKWTLEQFKTELIENRKERVDYLKALAEIKDGVTEHNSRSREFMNSVAAEHREMILTLGRINGYKDVS